MALGGYVAGLLNHPAVGVEISVSRPAQHDSATDSVIGGIPAQGCRAGVRHLGARELFGDLTLSDIRVVLPILALTFEPKSGDLVTYNGKEYRVRDVSNPGPGNISHRLVCKS